MKKLPRYLCLFWMSWLATSLCASAAESPPVVIAAPPPVSLVDRASATAQDAIDHAMDLLGIRYRRGGASPEAGFDCSGFVSHVFREGVGLILPRDAKAMSETGEQVDRDVLQPGDLVFFNTMRRAFSHVGIYLGQNQFVHSPSRGGQVRVDDMRDSYWQKRFNGARRVEAK